MFEIFRSRKVKLELAKKVNKELRNRLALETSRVVSLKVAVSIREKLIRQLERDVIELERDVIEAESGVTIVQVS